MRGAGGRAGFTLLEIMIVVFIIGLLATLVAPKLLGRAEDARRTKAVADMKAVQQALELYRLDTGDYPTTAQGLDALVRRPETPPLPRTWKPEGYLDRVPLDPWGAPYVYAAGGGRFTLKSLGADGIEGGEGRFADVENE
jgi:general secretion pathway protein G